MAATLNLDARAAFRIASITLMIFMQVSEAAGVVEVYRLIQYDVGSIKFGSRKSGLNHYATLSTVGNGTDLAASVIVTSIANVDIKNLNDIIQGNHSLGGYLFLLPRSFNASKKSEEESDEEDSGILKKVSSIEQILVLNQVKFPVYFAPETDYLSSLIREIDLSERSGKYASLTNGGYKFLVRSGVPQKLPSAQLSNIQGVLRGQGLDGRSSNLPTIAIVASYDTFGAAPDLSVGAVQSATAVTVLLEMARLFSRLYSDPKTRPGYNLLFALTAGGPYNYDGTKQWLANLDPRIVESLEFALCLTSIGSPDSQLYIHGSKSRLDPVIAPFYDALCAAAAEEGVELSVVHKKIKMADSRVPWEHEWFSRSKVPAVTLTGVAEPRGALFGTGGIADRRGSVNDSLVMEATKVAAEAIGRHIFVSQWSPNKSFEIFLATSSLAVSAPRVTHLLDLLSQHARVAPFLSLTGPVITVLKKELSLHVSEVTVQTVQLDGTYSLFDSTKSRLEVFQVAGVAFDILLSVGIALYLGSLFVLLSISTKGMEEFLAMFRRLQKSRKSKAA